MNMIATRTITSTIGFIVNTVFKVAFIVQAFELVMVHIACVCRKTTNPTINARTSATAIEIAIHFLLPLFKLFFY